MLSVKNKEITSDDKLIDASELEKLDPEKLKTWYSNYLNYVINQYQAYKSLSSTKRTKAKKIGSQQL